MTLHRRHVSTLALAALLLGPPAHAGGAEGPRSAPSTHGCRPGYIRPDFVALNRQLQAAQAKWAAAGLRNYTYDLRQLAAPVLFPEVRITVMDGRRTSLRPVQGDVMVALPMTAGLIEERFATVRQTLQAQQQTRCPDLKLRFDPALGYPTLVYSGTAEANVADGYGEWSIRRLVPLP